MQRNEGRKGHARGRAAVNGPHLFPARRQTNESKIKWRKIAAASGQGSQPRGTASKKRSSSDCSGPGLSGCKVHNVKVREIKTTYCNGRWGSLLGNEEAEAQTSSGADGGILDLIANRRFKGTLRQSPKAKDGPRENARGQRWPIEKSSKEHMCPQKWLQGKRCWA